VTAFVFCALNFPIKPRNSNPYSGLNLSKMQGDELEKKFLTLHARMSGVVEHIRRAMHNKKGYPRKLYREEDLLILKRLFNDLDVLDLTVAREFDILIREKLAEVIDQAVDVQRAVSPLSGAVKCGEEKGQLFDGQGILTTVKDANGDVVFQTFAVPTPRYAVNHLFEKGFQPCERTESILSFVAFYHHRFCYSLGLIRRLNFDFDKIAATLALVEEDLSDFQAEDTEDGLL
jgi:hypothetical protein